MKRASPRLIVIGLLLLCSCTDAAESSSTSTPQLPPAVVESGGATTTFDTTTEAFARSAANLDSTQRSAFAVGNAFFNDNWVIAPASTTGRDGLGPVFNALSCSGCHLHDGRAQPPDTDAVGLVADDASPGLLFRISVPGQDAHGGPAPEPTYGGQFADRAIPGVPAEGTISVTHTTIAGSFADGAAYTLDKPTYRLDGALGPMAGDAMVSARIAPALTGMGLLEAIPADEITAAADPDDTNGDGISGRTNAVWDIATESMRLGRFGWKAGQPTVEQQVAGAFQGDIGITSSVQPDQPCTPAETACAAAPDGGEPELDDNKLQRVTFYSRTLGVPARRAVDEPDVTAGAQLFATTGCSSCHTPTLQTGDSDVAQLADQVIHPYTDLLLHDMGDDLADGRPEFAASGNEWRTPPLWGLGLVQTVSGHTHFLHDGRARSVEEAILWHGGEAAAAQKSYRGLTAAERAQLLVFLDSL